MRSVISYTLSHCQKCMKCLKVCPTEAITIIEERVHIDSRRCINCGHCIEVCNTLGLQGKGSTPVDIANYQFTVALLPSAIYTSCSSLEEAAQLHEAIRKIGFDEVIDMSDLEGAIAAEIKKKLSAAAMKPLISSFCPAVNRLIRLKYPMLLDHLVDINYPNEIAAEVIRQRYKDKGNVGIFYFCECVAKLQQAKYPYGNQNSQIDHALSIGDQLPLIRMLKSSEKSDLRLCKEGLCSASLHHGLYEGYKVVEADGKDKVTQVLELAEFDLLDSFDYLSLAFCSGGCLGGKLLWGNPFEAELNLKKLLESADKPAAELNEVSLSKGAQEDVSDPLTMKEKLKLFASINEVMEKLPHYDCGACGFASCRNMAENIVLKRRTLKDCQILKNSEVKE